MSVVYIKVSRLSHKILEKDFSGSPVELHRRHPLWPVVAASSSGRGSDEMFDRSYPFLFQKSETVIPRHLGRTLHAYHIERMMRWTQSLHEGNCMPARPAINLFYGYYDIDEDDYDFSQTAYKSWQRWSLKQDETKKKNSAERAGFYEKYVLSKMHILRNSFDPPTVAELELRCNQVAMKLFNWNHESPDELYRQVQIFIWRSEGARTTIELAKIFKCADTTITRSVNRVMHYAKYDEEFRKIFE